MAPLMYTRGDFNLLRKELVLRLISQIIQKFLEGSNCKVCLC